MAPTASGMSSTSPFLSTRPLSLTTDGTCSQLETGKSDRYATYSSGSGTSTSPSSTSFKTATTQQILISFPQQHSPSMAAASTMPPATQPSSPSLLQVKPAPLARMRISLLTASFPISRLLSMTEVMGSSTVQKIPQLPSLAPPPA